MSRGYVIVGLMLASWAVVAAFGLLAWQALRLVS